MGIALKVLLVVAAISTVILAIKDGNWWQLGTAAIFILVLLRVLSAEQQEGVEGENDR